MLTNFQQQHDESQCYERTEGTIEFVVAGGNSSEALEMMDTSLDFIAEFVEFLVLSPRLLHVRLRRHDGDALFVPDRFASLLVCIAPVHHDAGSFRKRCRAQELPALRSIVPLSGAQGKGNPCMSSGDDHVDLRRETTPRSSEGLRSLFLRAPLAD